MTVSVPAGPTVERLLNGCTLAAGGAAVTCALADLAPGSSVNIGAGVFTLAPGAQYVVTARATSANGGDASGAKTFFA